MAKARATWKHVEAHTTVGVTESYHLTLGELTVGSVQCVGEFGQVQLRGRFRALLHEPWRGLVPATLGSQGYDFGNLEDAKTCLILRAEAALGKARLGGVVKWPEKGVLEVPRNNPLNRPRRYLRLNTGEDQ